MHIRPVDVVRLGVLLCVLQMVAQGQRPEILYLRFSETSGTTTLDRAVPGLTGVSPTLQNGAVFNTNTNSAGGASLAPACLKTAGVSQDACTINTTFTVNGDWTIEFWIIDTQASPNGKRYVFGDPSINGLACYRDASISNNALIFEGAGMSPVTINTATQFATWKHVALVHDSRAQTIRPYVNGVQQAHVVQPVPISLVGSGPTGLIIGGNGTGNTPWQGRIDEFRVWDRALTTAEIGGNRLGHVNAAADDVACSSIIDPLFNQVNCLNLTASTPVTIEVTNTGTNTIIAGTMIPVDVKINGTIALSDTLALPSTLSTGQKAIVQIPTGVNMTGLTAFNLEVTLNYPGDGVSLNDSFSRTIVAGVPPITVFPDTEDFDGAVSNNTTVPPLGWVQPQTESSGADSDWYFANQPTPTIGTGPTADHTTGTAGQGYFAYVEDAGNHAAVTLMSKCYDFTALSSPRVKFWVWSENSQGAASPNMNFLSVDVLTSPGNAVTMNVLPATGHLGSGWQPIVVDLAAFAGSTARIIFRGRSDGGSDVHDIAIDDVTVFEFVPGVGQPPVPGVAEFDINNAQSPGLSLISSGDAGPYSTTVTVGSLLDFKFFGEANQTIILLLGNKNPAVATFANVGIIDIGGPIDPMTGVPTGISVFADGSVPSGFNPFFNTTATGFCNVFFTMPAVPPGILTTFQAIMFNSTSPVGLTMTNAIEVTVN